MEKRKKEFVALRVTDDWLSDVYFPDADNYNVKHMVTVQQEKSQ
jgi:hypothetical protein